MIPSYLLASARPDADRVPLPTVGIRPVEALAAVTVSSVSSSAARGSATA